MPPPKVQARFIEPMLLVRTETLPEGDAFVFELKLDGFRVVAVKTGGKVHLRSRNNKDFSVKYHAIAKALAAMPDETVIDGEIVAMDDSGRLSFTALQNYGSSSGPVLYYVFDLMVVGGKDVMHQSLKSWRDLLRALVLPKLGDPIRESPELEANLPDLIASVKAQGLEALVASAGIAVTSRGRARWRMAGAPASTNLLAIPVPRHCFGPRGGSARCAYRFV
jgi:ATP-dependent DNA ligase